VHEPQEERTMNLKPLADRVLVKVDSAPDMKGGLFLPPSAQKGSRSGEVVAVGPGKLTDKGERLPMELKEGDRVILGPVTGGRELSEGSDKYVLMLERDVLAIEL
jgi:chaperonin GroES